MQKIKKLFSQKTNYGNLLFTAWNFCPTQKFRFIQMYVLSALAQIIWELDAVFLGWAVALLTTGEASFLYVLMVLSLIPLSNFLSWTLHGPARIIERELAFDVMRNYRKQLFSGLLTLPLKWHQDNHSGAIISRCDKAAGALLNFTQNQFDKIQTFMMIFITFGAFVYFNWKSSIIAFLMLIISVQFIRWIDKKYVAQVHQRNETMHKVRSNFIDTIANAVTVITLRIKNRMTTTFGHTLDAVEPPFKKEIRLNEWKWFGISMLAACTIIIVLAPEAHALLNAQETTLGIGGFVTLSAFAKRYTDAFFRLADKLETIIIQNTDLKSADPLWTAIEEHQQAHPQNTQKTEQKLENIHIKTIQFTHTEDENTHDLNIHNLTLPKGAKIALIGESGSGKSTLLRVLRGLYPANTFHGTLHNSSIPLSLWLSHHTTLIPQDPEIFEESVQFNITLGAENTKEEIQSVIKMAQFHNVLKRIPRGLQTDIRERGLNLSGGEKQRLALARGLLAGTQSDVILMDEPTSSVDLKNEDAIYTNIFTQWKNKTIVVSLHRLSLLHHFSYIVELSNGELLWQGTPEEYKKKKSIQ